MLQKFTDLILEPMLDGSDWLHVLSVVVIIALIFAAAVITYYLVKLIIKIITAKLLKIEKSVFLKVLSKDRVFDLLAHIASGMVLWLGGRLISEYRNPFSNYEALILEKLSLLYIFIMCLLIISRLIWSVNNYYEKHFEFAKQYPIYSYLKVAILFIWVIGIVLIVSFFLQTSPWALLTGVGAISALLLLVFKDTLLGVISSIQVTALNIVRIGDRISLDKYGVDGRVIDISINTVKIKNSDNTLSYIPTYMLTTEIVKNWRVVEETGSRHIQRAVYLDPQSVITCDTQLLDSLQHLVVIREYIQDNPDTEFINLTLFRVFFQDYLDNYTGLNHNELTMVRHLDPLNIGGLPLEVFAYTTIAKTKVVEQIQAEIFEHLFSMLPVFALKVYRQS